MSAPHSDGIAFAKDSLFKDGARNVAAGGSHLQKSFAGFSECNTDLTLNYNKLSEAQASCNRSASEYQKQLRFHDEYPALREATMKAQQVAQSELQAREKGRDQMLATQERQIITLTNSLYRSGHIDPHAFEDLKTKCQSLNKSTGDLNKSIERLEKEARKLTENQTVTFTKLGGLQIENEGQRGKLIELSKVGADLAAHRSDFDQLYHDFSLLRNDFDPIRNELGPLRSEFNQEKDYRESMSSGFKEVKLIQEQLLKERENSRSEVKALKVEQKKMVDQIREMQEQLAQMSAPQASAYGETLKTQEAVKLRSINESETSEKVDILWSVVVGDEDKRQAGLLDEMKSISKNIKTEVSADIRTESKNTDNKVEAAQSKIKREFNEMFTNDLNHNLIPLEERLDKLESQHGGSLHGGVSLEDIKQDIERNQKIKHESLTMQIRTMGDRMVAAEDDQRLHIATLRVDYDRLKANLEQILSQRPISAPQSKASSPTPPYGHENVMQKIDSIEGILEDQKEQFEELVSRFNAGSKQTIKQSDEHIAESKHISQVSDSVSRLIKLVFGSSLDIQQDSYIGKPLIERIDVLTRELPLMRKELEDDFNTKCQAHASIFHDFSEDVKNRFHDSGIITSEPIEVDPLKAITEVPSQEAAAMKTLSKNRPLAKKSIPNGINTIQTGQGSSRSPGSMSPALALQRTSTPRVSNPNSPRPNGDNGNFRSSNDGAHDQMTSQSTPAINAGSGKMSKRQKSTSGTKPAGENGSIPDLGTPSTASTPRPQPETNNRKRGHPPGSGSHLPAAKKHSKLPARSPRKTWESDPAAYEDPGDQDYAEEGDDDDESVIISQSRRHKPKTRTKSTGRPNVFDVPND